MHATSLYNFEKWIKIYVLALKISAPVYSCSFDFKKKSSTSSLWDYPLCRKKLVIALHAYISLAFLFKKELKVKAII